MGSQARTVGISVVLVAIATGHAEEPDSPPRVETTPELAQRVNDAVDQGIAWMRKQQATDGTFAEYPGHPGGTTALAYYTLRICGVSRDDPSLARSWEAMQRAYRRAAPRTYVAALCLLAIAEHGEIDPSARDGPDVRLSASDRRWAEDLAGLLAGCQNREGCWSYGAGSGSVFDHSNTQFALLGLAGAARCGIRVDATVWKRSLVHFVAAQQRDGPKVARRLSSSQSWALRAPGANGSTSGAVDRARGWDYRQDDPRAASTAMTAGGVSSILLCRNALLTFSSLSPKLEVESARAVRDGLAWLGTAWRPETGRPGTSAPPDEGDVRLRMVEDSRAATGYEFYGVERAADLAGAESIGELDWYGVGARQVLVSQQRDGGWTSGNPAPESAEPGAPGEPELNRAMRVVETSFSLLFLRRATTRYARSGTTQPADETDIRFDVAATLDPHDFEDFLDLVLLRWRRTTDAGVRARLFDGATAVGPRIVQPLIIRLDAADCETRDAAGALLRRATDLDFGYVAAATSAAREPAVVRWQAWWISAARALRYDAKTSRLTTR